MIELYTGVPGSAKTLSMVSRLAALFKRWEKFPEEARPVFVHNIPHLAFPVCEVPFKLEHLSSKSQHPVLVPDWKAMPDGALVLIDEAQGKIDEELGKVIYHCFPARSTASEVPFHVAWLNTHRHHGFDIWLATQQPKLIDGAVRALVGRHQHLRRLFGGARSVVYEWDSCSDNIATSVAIKSYFPFPKDSFKFYKSAEIHTKQTFKLPAFVYLPVLFLLMGVLFIPKAYSVLHSGMTGQGLGNLPASPASSVAAAPVLPPAPEIVEPVSAEGGALAPTVADTPSPIINAVLDLPDSCIQSASDCRCYQSGHRLDMTVEACSDFLNKDKIRSQRI